MNKRAETKLSCIYNNVPSHNPQKSVIFDRNIFKIKDTKSPKAIYNKNDFNLFNVPRHSSQQKLNNQTNPEHQETVPLNIRTKAKLNATTKLKKAMTIKDQVYRSEQKVEQNKDQRLYKQIEEKVPERVHRQIPSFVKKKSQGVRLMGESGKLGGEGSKISEQFKKLKKLGQGKFGQVYLVKEQHTNMILAMKIVQKKFIIQGGFLKQFIRELKLQAFLKHPNIIQLYGFFHDQHQFYLLFQCGCHGQLYQFMEKSSFTQASTSVITRSLLSSAQYMHQNNVLHRDIKPQNIVIIHGVVKLCDLGWAVNTEKQQLRQTFCGTPLYLSPQIIIGNKYDQKVDLWAIGIICYQLIFKSSPFQIKNQRDLLRIVTSQISYPSNQKPSRQLSEFMEKILEKNPKERCSAEQLLKLTFIKKHNDNDNCQELI